MKRMLFVASLPDEKHNSDGERNKSRDVLNCLKTMGFSKIDIINYTRNRYIQTLKLLLLVLFRCYDCIFVSKCIVGGSFAIHLIRKIRERSNIIFYLIGNGYRGFETQNLYFDDINHCNFVIVESPDVLKMMQEKGLSKEKARIFPCLKPCYDISVKEKRYPSDKPLKLLYFSRIYQQKGLRDVIDAVIELNEKHHRTLFSLDISGGVSNEPEVRAFNEEVLRICEQHDYLTYLGMSLRIDGINAYKRIQEYDLHVFPSRFVQECAPGSIVDMFVAGIPTLSSSFPSAKYLMDDENSYFFEQNNNEDLRNKLMYIYNHQDELNAKRHLSHKEYEKYSENAFQQLLGQMGVGSFDNSDCNENK